MGLRYVVDTNRELSQVLSETNESGAITAHYVYGLGLAYKVMPDGTHYYYHFDAIGSTVAMTDDSRRIVNSYAYDPFGRVTNSVEGVANPFQFVGRYGVMQESNGLTFMRARYYAPDIGVFTREDPVQSSIQVTQNLNLYSYVNNNPLTRIDPDGLFGRDTASKVTSGFNAVGLSLGLSGATIFAGWSDTAVDLVGIANRWDRLGNSRVGKWTERTANSVNGFAKEAQEATAYTLLESVEGLMGGALVSHEQRVTMSRQLVKTVNIAKAIAEFYDLYKDIQKFRVAQKQLNLRYFLNKGWDAKYPTLWLAIKQYGRFGKLLYEAKGVGTNVVNGAKAANRQIRGR